MDTIVKIGSEAFKRRGENITLQQLAQAEEDGLWTDPEIWMRDNEGSCSIYSFSGYYGGKYGLENCPPVLQAYIGKFFKGPIRKEDGSLNMEEVVKSKWRWEAENGLFHGDWNDPEVVKRATKYYELNPKDMTLHVPASDKDKINKIFDTKETHSENNS